MLKTRSIIGLLVFMLFAKFNFSQTGKDTIVMLNGSVLIGTVIDTTNGVTSVKNPKDINKNIIIENDRIFSITNPTGEYIMYVYDTLIGNEFTIEEMSYFILGEQDAEKGYKARGAFFGNMLIGAVGGVTGSFLCPLPVFIFTAASGLPRVKVRSSTVSNIDYIKHETYIMGYERVARKKRKIGSLAGGVIGMGAGLGTFFILRANHSEIKLN
ncbi:hypothetical protein BH10BAC1_BH10BAC1_03550 [soil metagenome]